MCLLIAVIAASVVLVPRLVPDDAEQETFTQADSLLADSLLKQWEAKHPTYQKKTYQKKTYKKPEPVPLRLHYFDPNTADSLSLLELGLKPWQAKNLLRYREKGGRYREPADFRKLYGSKVLGGEIIYDGVEQVESNGYTCRNWQLAVL